MATATEAGSIPATKTSLALLFTLGRTYAPLVGVGDGKHVLTANEEDAARAMNVGRGGFVAAGAAAPMRRVKPAPAKTKAGAAGGVVHPMHAVPHLQLAKLANAGRKTKGGVWRAGNRKNPFRGAVAPPEPPATPPTPPEMRAKRAQKALVDGQSNCITVSLADFVSVWDTVALFIRTQMLRARVSRTCCVLARRQRAARPAGLSVSQHPPTATLIDEQRGPLHSPAHARFSLTRTPWLFSLPAFGHTRARRPCTCRTWASSRSHTTARRVSTSTSASPRSRATTARGRLLPPARPV